MFTKGMSKIGGRKQGIANRLTSTFREAVLLAYENIGGHEAFSNWAAENRADFYKIAARLIPTEIKGSEDQKIVVVIDRTCHGNPDAGSKGRPALTGQSQTLEATKISQTFNSENRTSETERKLIGND